MLFRRPQQMQYGADGMPMARRGLAKGRLLIALVMAGFALVQYFGSSEYNPIIEQEQRLGMSKDQEIALGLQAAPRMADQYGGLDANAADQARVDAVGKRLVESTVVAKTDWNFEFHLLGDRRTINAFALPGGQVFITRALYDQLENEDQLAGVIGHEIGHVVARHGAQQMAKQRLTQGLTTAVVVAADDRGVGSMAAMMGQMLNMRYGREDELQSDDIGVRLLVEAGYDPEALIGVMKILARAGGGRKTPEFFSTHPNPENRVEHIKAAIQKWAK